MKAFIFDLDGVIVFTDKFHYQAWKKLADDRGIYFDEEINNRLRGVSRMDSLEIILERYEGEPLSQQEKEDLAEKKNGLYRELLNSMTLEDAEAGVDAAKAGGMLAIGIGEARKYDKTDFPISKFKDLLKFVKNAL